MLPGLSTLATGPLAVPDVSYAIADPLQRLLRDPDAQFSFLFVASPRDATGNPVTVYLSDHGFATGPADDPPNQPFPPRLQTAFNFEATIPAPGSDGAGQTSFGDVRLANGDGELDTLLGHSWIGAAVEVLVGGTVDRGLATEQTLSYADYGLLFRGTVEAVSADDQTITLTLRDPMARLEVPAQSALYAGTGGVEGGADLKGRRKPLGWGPCSNVPPVQVDAVNLVFQFSTGSSQAVTAVRDKGVPLAFAADYPDYAALIAATIPAGEYATCLAGSLIRLGAMPAGQVTVDFEGDDTGGYVDTAPTIVRRIATTLGGLSDPDEIDPVAFGDIAAPQKVSLWLGPDDGRTVAECLRVLMASVDGWAIFDRQGRLTVGIFTAPEGAISTATLSAARDAGRSLTAELGQEPAWRYRVGYGRLGLAQSPDDLAASVSAADRDLYGQELRWAPYEDAAVQSRHAKARDVERPTLLADADDAAAEAQRLVERDGQLRWTYRMEVTRGLLRFRPGQVVTLEQPRFGLESGKRVRITRMTETVMREPAQQTVHLELWG